MDEVGVVLVHDFGLEGAAVEEELREGLGEEEGLWRVGGEEEWKEGGERREGRGGERLVGQSGQEWRTYLEHEDAAAEKKGEEVGGCKEVVHECERGWVESARRNAKCQRVALRSQQNRTHENNRSDHLAYSGVQMSSSCTLCSCRSSSSGVQMSA